MMRMRTGIVDNMLCVKSESIIWIVDLKFKYLPSSPRHITTTDGDPACCRSSLLELCYQQPAKFHRAFSLLKAPTSAFTVKNPLRHYAKQVFKHGE